MSHAICHVFGQCDQLGDRLVDELKFLKQLDIPADISVGNSHDPSVIPFLRDWSNNVGLVAPGFYPPGIDPACRDSNWWAYDADTCTRLLTIAQERVRLQGLGDLEAITTYTPGNGLIEACRKVGVRFLLGFCAPTVINDGHWQITHTGAPVGPYLAGTEDFRKPGTDSKPVLISSMELRNPQTCGEHWSEGPFCPLNLIMGDRTIETGEYPIETMAACEDWIRLSELSGVPRFFHVNLQWFTSPRCIDLNRRCLEWLSRQARMGRIKFTTMRQHIKALTETKGVFPQTIWWRGSCMGQTIGAQPAGGVECIVRENTSGQLQFKKGEAGPVRFYDYSLPWKCKPFDPLGLDPAFVSPVAAIKNLNREAMSENRIKIQFSWETQKPGTLCCWEALKDLRAPFSVIDAGNLPIEIVPHPGGVGGAILFDASTLSGDAQIVIVHNGESQQRHSIRWNDIVAVESVIIDNRPITRIASNVPAPIRFPLSIIGKNRVRWESINGGDVRSGHLDPGDMAEVDIDGRFGASVVRLWDTDAAGVVEPVEVINAQRTALTAAAQTMAEEFSSDEPRPTKPQCFGAEADTPAWAMVAARKGADREIAIVDPIAARLGRGTLVAAGHMACDLPFGSQGRVRSQRYDRWFRTGASELFAIFYDYGQSIAPGVAGWNQFVSIGLGARGLVPKARYRLVLNTYDPERRNCAIRILGSACDDHGRALDRNITYELRAQVPVVQGSDARHSEKAFITLDLPTAMTADGAINIGLRSHSEAVRYDRLSEGFGFVFLSHAWLFEY